MHAERQLTHPKAGLGSVAASLVSVGSDSVGSGSVGSGSAGSGSAGSAGSVGSGSAGSDFAGSDAADSGFAGLVSVDPGSAGFDLGFDLGLAFVDLDSDALGLSYPDFLFLYSDSGEALALFLTFLLTNCGYKLHLGALGSTPKLDHRP